MKMTFVNYAKMKASTGPKDPPIPQLEGEDEGEAASHCGQLAKLAFFGLPFRGTLSIHIAAKPICIIRQRLDLS